MSARKAECPSFPLLSSAAAAPHPSLCCLGCGVTAELFRCYEQTWMRVLGGLAVLVATAAVPHLWGRGGGHKLPAGPCCHRD